MNTRNLILLGLALSALAGCRVDPAIPLLERELRIKEDEIYRLRSALEDLQCEAQWEGARSTAAAPDERDSAPRRGRKASVPSDTAAPAVELPGKPAARVPDALKNPGGDLPPVDDVPDAIRGPSRPTSSTEGGPSLGRSAGDYSDFRGHRAAAVGEKEAVPFGLSGTAEPFTPKGDSRRVASIVLDKTLTGGIAANDASGDQGVLVVVEPRDADGRPLDAPAEVNVAVLDPALPGEEARVARWNFSAAETAALFRRIGSGGAMHLAMAWPEKPPQHNKLHLFVRYLTADGRKLTADQPIEIALPGERTARWTHVDPSPRGAPSVERESAPSAGAWRAGETPTARRAAATPARVASRPTEPKLERPVWSPERP